MSTPVIPEGFEKYYAVIDWPIPQIHHARGYRVLAGGYLHGWVEGPLMDHHPINEQCAACK